MSKERSKSKKIIYKNNRERVYDIYGIPKKQRSRSYDVHHIVFQSDTKNRVFKNFNIDGKANLYPLPKKVHQELHTKINKMRDEK